MPPVKGAPLISPVKKERWKLIKDIRIVARVTEKEKNKIERNASKCGLSTSEYVKQRALGFEPKAVLPDAFFRFCEKFDALIDMGISKDVEAEAFNLLAEISDVLIKPRKEQIENWQPPDSGP